MPATKRKGKASLYNKGAKVFRKYKGGKSAGRKPTVAQVKQVVRAMKEDLGGVDTSLLLSPVISTTNTNGSAFVLNLVQQGTGSWNRIGRKIALQSVRLRYAVAHKYTNTATTLDVDGNRFRMVLVWDKSPNSGSIPTFDTVFGLTDQQGNEATTMMSPVKYDNMGRFSVLRDCVITPVSTVNPPTGGTGNFVLNYYEVDEFVKLNGKETTFSATNNPSTISDISTGALIVYFRAEEQSATNFMIVGGDAFARLRYNP